MIEFIEECLKPNYKIHWLESIYFDQKLLNDIQMYIVFNDNRLLRI